MTRPLLSIPIGYAPAVVDKVERLLEVLAALREDPVLGNAFVLHGGTALNLFYEPAPRLSIDIDLLYIEEADLAQMRARRPETDARFCRLISSLGYTVRAMNDEHSGQTYRLRYPGDFVKVDISYLSRVTMLEPAVLACPVAEPEVRFPVLQLPELAAGKIKALMERRTARDLYDLHRLSARHPALFDDDLARALAIRAISTADPFPLVKDPKESLAGFRKLPSESAAALHAMLAADDRPGLLQMISSVSDWLAPLSLLSEKEKEYFCLLDENSLYRPDLLFGQWPDILGRARTDPVMAWKVHHLQRRN